ncbi:hypothetical protein [Candidatus Poriferisocius sp.]|uniref:hypothetical protein n=1 Tax=Candidatus Poriferisocius sp. TaxID=3101276 RepID=UPI003B01D874
MTVRTLTLRIRPLLDYDHHRGHYRPPSQDHGMDTGRALLSDTALTDTTEG